MTEAFIFAATVVISYMSGLFIVSAVIKRNDLADLGWGPGFLVLALSTAFWGGQSSAKIWLVTSLVFLWSMRLAIHILPRLRRKDEDFRYAQWRRQWGRLVYVRSFFQVFMLQGLLMLLVGASIVVNAQSSSDITWLNWLGVAVWVFGFVFEAVGDRQLSQFLSKPASKGKIMDQGLWRYTRHPNYFGEVTQWWGLWLVVLPSAYWYVALVSPLTITILILFVSGIPLLEKKFADKPGWKEYTARTSPFIPLPRRK
jgi:steroid 5-alpha reductase family enzyme